MATRALALQVVLLTLLSGCSSDRAFLSLEAGDASTSVLATRESPSSAWTWIAAGASDRPRLEVEPEQETWLLLYDETPPELGLTDGAEARCRVLHPRDTLVLSEVDGVWTWAAAELEVSLGLALVADPYRCDPCAPLQGSAVLGPENARFRGAARFDDERVLLANERGLSLATRDAIEALPACSGLTDSIWSLASAGPGRFWVGGGVHELALIELSSDGQRCTVETSTSVGAWSDATREDVSFSALAPHPQDPSVHDLIAVRSTGEVFRWTASGLELLGRMAEHPQTTLQRYQSALRLDATTTLTIHGWNKVYVWRDDQLVRVEPLELPPSAIDTRPRDRLTTLRLDAARDRILVGSAHGDLWSRAPSETEWTQLAQSAAPEPVGSFWGGPTRYVIIHEGGDVGFLHYEEGLCDQIQRVPQATRSSPFRVAVEMDDWLFVADVDGNQERAGAVAWLREPRDRNTD